MSEVSMDLKSNLELLGGGLQCQLLTKMVLL